MTTVTEDTAQPTRDTAAPIPTEATAATALALQRPPAPLPEAPPAERCAAVAAPVVEAPAAEDEAAVVLIDDEGTRFIVLHSLIFCGSGKDFSSSSSPSHHCHSLLIFSPRTRIRVVVGPPSSSVSSFSLFSLPP